MSAWGLSELIWAKIRMHWPRLPGTGISFKQSSGVLINPISLAALAGNSALISSVTEKKIEATSSGITWFCWNIFSSRTFVSSKISWELFLLTVVAPRIPLKGIF